MGTIGQASSKSRLSTSPSKSRGANESLQLNDLFRGFRPQSAALGSMFLREPDSAVVQGNVTPVTVAQAKLTIGDSNDPLEQEADRVAAQVLEKPPLKPSGPCACGGSCPACQSLSSNSSTGPIQTKSVGAGHTEGVTAPPVVEQVLATPGRPLDPATRAYFEPRFGHDFSGIRIHADSEAAGSAQAVQARAYTVGQHLVFGQGQFAPGSETGNRLIAHELTHTLQQGYGVIRREDEPPACATRYTRARSFSAYIDLVREAERRLIAAGYTSVEDRVHVLRGIYYGTTWSADYRVERSPVRNAGFQVYTASTTPDDPRGILNCGLFEALRDSQDLVDGRRRVDVGHLMIGLDARRSWTARTVGIPTQGGTGLDISTWLGDLGGGAGMLAFRRVRAPRTRAMSMFRGTDFGGPINLEGDVAGFVVARDTSTTPSGPVGLTFTSGSTIADALASYLLPTASGGVSSEWSSRCRTFMLMLGATFSPAGTLTNRTTLINQLAGQISEFACWYLVNRLRQTSRLSISTLRTASLHISGASTEIATVFVDALNHCQATPGSNLAATGSGPAPSPIGSGSPTACEIAIRGLEAAEAAERGLRDMERRARELRDLLPF